MHEYSIVSSLLELCCENCAKHNAVKIFRIVIEVGVRSGVEISLLKSAFDVFKNDNEIYKDAELEIVVKEVVLSCLDCGSEFSAVGLEYGICQKCGGNKLKIISGRELNLLRLEME